MPKYEMTPDHGYKYKCSCGMTVVFYTTTRPDNFLRCTKCQDVFDSEVKQAPDSTLTDKIREVFL